MVLTLYQIVFLTNLHAQTIPSAVQTTAIEQGFACLLREHANHQEKPAPPPRNAVQGDVKLELMA